MARKKSVKKANLSASLSQAVLAGAGSDGPGDSPRAHIERRARLVIAALEAALQRVGADEETPERAEAEDLINRHYDGLFGLEHQSRARMALINLVRMQSMVTIGTPEQHAAAVIRTFSSEFVEEGSKLDAAKVQRAIDLWRRGSTGKVNRAQVPHWQAMRDAVGDFDAAVREQDPSSLMKEWSRGRPDDARTKPEFDPGQDERG